MSREMKYSGIPWIGDIPKDWEVCRIKDVAMLYNGNSIKDEEKDNYTNPENTYPYISTKDIDATYLSINYTNGLYTSKDDSTFKIAQKDSCLMCIEGGSAGKKKAYVEQDVSFVNKLCCFAPHKMDGKYLFYYLCSPTFESEFYKYISGLIGGVSVSTLKNFIQLLPSLAEQQKIASFLDRKCSEIDEMIALQEKIVEELKAYKQSVITEAVTKGLNPDAPMKDSGIGWIGEIPEHWRIEPLKYNLKRRSAKNNPILTTERLSLSIDKGVTLYSEKTTNLDRFKEDFTQYQLAYPNDIVLNCMNMIVGAVGLSRYFGCVSPVYYVIYPSNSGIDAEYYSYFLNTPTIRGVYYSYGKGIYAIERGEGRVNTCRLKVSYDDFGRFDIPIPPIKEQKDIVKYITTKCTEIDNLISIKLSKIDSLKEYKKSIIYEYVTGKREVE